MMIHLYFQEGDKDSRYDDIPKERLGRLLGFYLLSSPSGYQLHQFQLKEVPAILDVKWCHYCPGERPMFGVVDASGRLTLNLLETDATHKYTCTEISNISVGEDRLALSLDWSTGVHHR